jgi:hypothetical protein
LLLASTTGGGNFTGARANVFLNSSINTNGGGASYYPGTSAVVIASGGQYV